MAPPLRAVLWFLLPNTSTITITITKRRHDRAHGADRQGRGLDAGVRATKRGREHSLFEHTLIEIDSLGIEDTGDIE